MTYILRFIAALLFSVFFMAEAQAASVEFMDLNTLTQQADRIWLAKIADVSAHFLPGDRRIVSDAQLDILDVIKGDAVQDKLRPSVLRVSGGVVADIGQWVPGSAQLTTGKTVLVFAEAHGQDAQGRDVYRVVGMAQGLFIVEPDAQGQDRVRQQLDGLTAVDRQGQIKTQQPAPAQSLKTLLQRLRREIAAESH